jgi:hypothetical protein
MSEQQLFQETPRDTSACTLVNDTPDSNRIREFIKEKLIKKLKAKDEDYEIVENQFQWSISQRYVEKPAIINIRLKSYKKGMSLVAYNSFEIYHGNCEIAKMRIRNDLANDKLEKHVDDAIKSFKEQAEFGRPEAENYKKEHTKELKAQIQMNKKLEKDFQGFDLNKNKDGLVKVFMRYTHYHSSGRRFSHSDYATAMNKSDNGDYVQLVDVVKCNVFWFLPKMFKPANTKQEPKPTENNLVYIYASYSNVDGLWKYIIKNLDVEKLLVMYKKHSNGITVLKKNRYDNELKKTVCKPYMEIGHKNRGYSDTKMESEFEHTTTTKEMIELVDKLGLRVWKIEQD